MYTDLEFIIVGDGTLRNTVTKVIPKIRNKVTYHGFVPHQRVPGILSNVDINIIPSFTEGMPTVCLEAFASRIPVVCSKVGGLPELVSQGETGLLMNPGDVNTCVKNVSTLISNRDMRNTMGEACRKLVEDNYSWDIILKKTELLYTKILGA